MAIEEINAYQLECENCTTTDVVHAFSDEDAKMLAFNSGWGDSFYYDQKNYDPPSKTKIFCCPTCMKLDYIGN